MWLGGRWHSAAAMCCRHRAGAGIMQCKSVAQAEWAGRGCIVLSGVLKAVSQGEGNMGASAGWRGTHAPHTHVGEQRCRVKITSMSWSLRPLHKPLGSYAL